MKDKRLLPALLTIIGFIVAILAQRIFEPASILRIVFLAVAFVIFAISLVLLIKFWWKRK
ncbi:MAG: hypothetical protein LBB41_05855 [Prevotellaceae bacterium]|jgi:uncharacterized membrane protein YoaK (UPF0700 family)|nr:hypothetical protein [Prevotellaceae bacterium]